MLKLVLLFTVAAAAVANAQIARKVGGGLFKTPVATLGGWEIAKFTKDAAGKQLVFCTAIVITGQEQALRFERNPKTSVWGFMGNASSAVGPTPTISYWFDNLTSEKTTVKAKLITSPEESVEWLTYSQTNDEVGDEELYKEMMKVSYSYKYQGKNVVQSFSLKGANAALKRLQACVGD
jgi:hypothetical protein